MAWGSWLALFAGRARSQGREFSSAEELRAAVIERLKLAAPRVQSVELDRADPARFSFVLNGQESSGDVTNLFGYIMNYPEQNRDELIDRFVRTLQFEETKSLENFVTLVRSKDVIDLRGAQANSKPIYAPLAGELMSYGMHDTEDAIVSADLNDFPGRSAGEMLVLGTRNVSRYLSKLVYDESIHPIVLAYVEGNPLLTSGLLLVDEFWSDVSKRISDDVFVAIPRRDQVFLLDARLTDAVPAMRKLIELTFQDGFSLLSSELYRHRNGKLELSGI